MFYLIIVIYTAFICRGLSDALLGAAWPVMQQDFGVAMSMAGIITIIISIGRVISSFLCVKVIKWLGTGKTTALCMLITALSLLGCSFSLSFIGLCIFSIPLGLAMGAIDAALNQFVAVHYHARQMNWLHCFWGVGITISPMLMAFFLTTKASWRGGYVGVAVLQGLFFVVLIATLALWKLVGKAKYATAKESSEYISTSKAFQIKGVTYAMLVFFLYCSLENIASLWGATYLVLDRGVTQSGAAGFLAIFFAGITVGRFLAGVVSSRLGNNMLTRIGEVMILCSVVLFILPLQLYGCLAGFLLLGLGCAPIYPSTMHETPARFGGAASQAVIGLQMGFAYIGATSMPPLFGLIADLTTIQIFPAMLLLLVVLLIIASEKLFRVKNSN